MNISSEGPKRVVEKGYDRMAEEYGRLEEGTVWPRMRWLSKLLDRLEPGSSVLDLGCGSGDPADIEISKGHHVTGVDISQRQIALARRNVPAGNFIHGDIGSVEFTPGTFGAVTVLYALSHIPRLEHGATLRRIHEWLQQGGLLLITADAGIEGEVTGQWLGVPMFFSSQGPEATRRLIEETGFELLETAVETQRELGRDVPFLWVLAKKGSGGV